MEKFKYLIPEESIDAIITNVAKLREIENSLRTIFSKNNYQEEVVNSDKPVLRQNLQQPLHLVPS